MIDEEKIDKYLWDLKSEPLFGKPIAEALLRKKSSFRKEVLIMLQMAEKGKFMKENLTKFNSSFTENPKKDSPKLNQICKCGHDWNFHDTLSGEACHEMECKCNKFNPTS